MKKRLNLVVLDIFLCNIEECTFIKTKSSTRVKTFMARSKGGGMILINFINK